MEQHFQVRPGIDLMPACPILWHRLLRAASLHHAPTFFKSSPSQFPAFLAGWKEDVEVTGNGRKGEGFLGNQRRSRILGEPCDSPVRAMPPPANRVAGDSGRSARRC